MPSPTPDIDSLLQLFTLHDEAFLEGVLRLLPRFSDEEPLTPPGEAEYEEQLVALRNGRLNRLEILALLLRQRGTPDLMEKYETLLPGPFLHGEHTMDPFENSPGRMNKKGVMGSMNPADTASLFPVDREEFLIYGPEEFLYRAYGVIMGRDPDPHGKEYYLDRLVSGRLSRDDILCRLVLSPEGRERKAKVAGLRCTRLRPLVSVLRRLPVVGSWFSLFRRGEMERAIHRLEYRLDEMRRELARTQERERERVTRNLDLLLTILAEQKKKPRRSAGRTAKKSSQARGGRSAKKSGKGGTGGNS